MRLEDRGDTERLIARHCRPVCSGQDVLLDERRHLRLKFFEVGIAVVVGRHAAIEDAGRPSAVVLLNPDVLDTVGRGLVDSEALERERVECHDVGQNGRPRLNHDGVVGRRLVEHVPIGQNAFFEIAPRAPQEVVRVADRSRRDPLTRGRDGRALPDAVDDVGVTRRIRDVERRTEECGEVHQVRVGVDQTRDDRGTGEVMARDVGTRRGEDIRVAADGRDLALVQPDRGRTLAVIARQNLTPRQDEVGDGRGRGRGCRVHRRSFGSGG